MSEAYLEVPHNHSAYSSSLIYKQGGNFGLIDHVSSLKLGGRRDDWDKLLTSYRDKSFPQGIFICLYCTTLNSQDFLFHWNLLN